LKKLFNPAAETKTHTPPNEIKLAGELYSKFR